MRRLVYAVAVCIALASCSGVRYVSVPETHTKTETTARVDTILKERIKEVVRNGNERNDRWRSDSTVIRLDINGKELGRDHWYREVNNKQVTNEIVISDSVYEKLLTMFNHDRLQADSIAKPYPVEKELGWWDSLKLRIFEPVILLLTLSAVLLIRKHSY